MQHKLKNRLILTVIFLFLLLIIVWIFKSNEFNSAKQEINASENYDYLPYFIKAGERLNHFWSSGSYPGLGEKVDTCGELHWEKLETGEDYLKCNPQLLQCYFSGQIPNAKKDFEIEFNNRKEVIKLFAKYPPVKNLSRKKRYYQTLRNYSLEVTLVLKSNPKVSYVINLERNCNETYLPKLEYSHSQEIFKMNEEKGERDNVKKWKNEKNIFIDQYLVSKHDVFEWKSLNNMRGLEKDIFSWTEYADNLTLNEMKDFCHDRGKKLISSRVHDAASFYRNLKEKEGLTSLFAWGDRNKGLISPRADFNDHYDKNDHVKERTCTKIPISECKERFRTFERDNISWMGIYDVMGGLLEAVDNQEAPYFNINASSFYFDRFSPWHILSHRFHWDGKAHKNKNFRFDSSLLGKKGDEIINENLKVGFRCMRVIQ